MTNSVAGFLKRAAREPLVQFLAVGAALFVINGLINGPDEGPIGESVVVTEGRVSQIAQSFLLLSGRLPTREELQSLVDDFVSEEVAYREAIAMGLDADDTIVRRRMRQKVEFLIEDGAASESPTETDLQAWFDAHPEKFRMPERRALRQVLMSGDKRGEAARTDAEAAVSLLQSGGDPANIGDRSMLPVAIPLTTQEGVSALFGADFAAAAFAASENGWFGPVASPFGQHVVTLVDVEPGRAVPLAEIADRVHSDWVEARRNAARDDFHARMRKRYDIQIEWPEPFKDLPATPDHNPSTRPTPEFGE